MRFLLILCLAIATPAAAERRVALVFAADEYRALRPLENPVRDALAVEGMLSDLGFEVTVETDRDLRRMRRALEDFVSDYKGADVALVFYAGHGVELGGVNYLLPVDATADTAAAIAETALPLAEVQAAMGQVAPVGIVLLDACREDPFGGATGEGRSAAPLDDANAPAPRPGLGRIGRADGVLFAFSAAPGEVASDGQGEHSPFADALLRHFSTPGVEVRTALTLVQQDVYDRSRGRQLPYVESGLPQLFFAASAVTLPEREALLIAMADLSPALRAEIEALAAERDMPLAPLYGALFSADLTRKSPAERSRALAESADAFQKFRAEVQALAADDPKVAELRGQAEDALALGEFARARVILTEAAGLDADARSKLRDNYRARTLSEAETHALAARAARADLRYDLALADLALAIPLYTELEGPALDRKAREDFTERLWDQGEMAGWSGDTTLQLAAYRQWRDVAAARVQEAPGDARYLRNLGVAEGNLGTVLYARGDLAGARAAFDASLAIAEDLAARPDAEMKWRHDVFVAGIRLADLFEAEGDLTAATATRQSARETLRRAVADFPGNDDLELALAVAEEELGDDALESGDLAAARASYALALDLRRTLVARIPDRAEFRWHLANGQTRMGDLALAEGKPEAALAVYRAAAKAFTQLVAEDAQNALLRDHQALALKKLAGALAATGNPDGGREAMAEVVAMNRELAARDPANTDWQAGLMRALGEAGQLALKAEDEVGAEAAFTESLAIARAQVLREPGNANWQTDLTMALDRMGDLAFKRMDLVGAEAHFRESFAITVALADDQPTSVEAQVNKVAGMVRIAMFEPDPKARLLEAKQILLDLKAAGKLDMAHFAWFPMIDQMIKLQE